MPTENLWFKAVNPVQEAKEASSAAPKIFSAAPLTQISQLFYLRSRARELKQQLLPEFYLSGMELDDPECRVWLVLESAGWVAVKAAGMKPSSVQKGCPVSESQEQSSSGEASCLSLFSRMGILPERRAWQRSESSRLSTLHVSETVHRASQALWADRPPALYRSLIVALGCSAFPRVLQLLGRLSFDQKKRKKKRGEIKQPAK